MYLCLDEAVLSRSPEEEAGQDLEEDTTGTAIEVRPMGVVNVYECTVFGVSVRGIQGEEKETERDGERERERERDRERFKFNLLCSIKATLLQCLSQEKQ